jgi:hypothetical protein
MSETQRQSRPVTEPLGGGTLKVSRVAVYWGLVPISMTMILGLVWGPLSGTAMAAMPVLANALTTANAAGANSAASEAGIKMVIPSPGVTGTPAGGSPTASPHGGLRTQFAARSTLSSVIHRERASGTLPATMPEYCCPAKLSKSPLIDACCSALNDRGDFSFSNANCASAVSFRNCSACVESSAMRSFALAVPSFAESDSAIARFVSTSLAATRSSENFSLMPANLIVPYVPKATSTAPTNRTTLEISNQKLAPSAETSNIRNLTDLLFGLFCCIWLAVIYEAGKRVYGSYKKLRR